MPKIGVLALQGDFEAHIAALQRAGADAFPVRTASELKTAEGLVIPGGESTTMLKLLDAESLFEPLRQYASVRPVFGTCAGAILLAKEVTNPAQRSFGIVDIAVERNGYGRQIDSRIVRVSTEPAFAARAGDGELEAVFIRAPIIRRVAKEAKVLANYQGDPVLVEQGPHLVATFHPELTSDSRVHGLFVEKVNG
jgi:5'-phosphate synthase pdxT subunit